MAKATTRFVEETVTTVVKKEDGVVLELSKEEAMFLVDVMSLIGGSPTNSRRMYERSITSALRETGLRSKYPMIDELVPQNSSIYFKDTL